MASVPITIVGTITGKSTKEAGASATEQCVIVGLASLSDLTVGGGPIYPPQQPPDVGIWPSPGRPEHPIVHPPPEGGGGQPPGIWPSPGVPTHPIVIPEPPPTQPPTEGTKPPPPGGGWGYHPDYGWGYFPGGGGKPQPPG